MFWFRLALHLGGTVAELKERMSSSEFTAWMCYYKMTPFGDDREDLRAALVAYTVAATTPRKRGAKPIKMQDFVLEFGERKQQSIEEMQQRVMMAAAIAKQRKKSGAASTMEADTVTGEDNVSTESGRTQPAG